MKQTKINLQKQRESVEETNKRCALIIEANRLYEGLMQEWARAILARAETEKVHRFGSAGSANFSRRSKNV